MTKREELANTEGKMNNLCISLPTGYSVLHTPVRTVTP